MSHLAWLLYLTDTILGVVVPTLKVISIMSILCLLVYTLIYFVEMSLYKGRVHGGAGCMTFILSKIQVSCIIGFLFILLLIPSESTTYKMIAANGITSVYEREDVQKLISEGVDILKLTIHNYKTQLGGIK